MPNTLTIVGETVTGIIHGTLAEPPELQRREIKYWGVKGSTEIFGERGARDFEVRMTVFANYSAATLTAAMKTWDRMTGDHGDVVVTNNDNGWSRTFKNVTFLGFLRGTDPTDGPVPDVAGTLDGGWWITGTFKFRQISNTLD
jgi:hypothetical protein